MIRSLFSAIVLSMFLVLSGSLFASSGASGCTGAAPSTCPILTFDGISNLKPIGNFYDGAGLKSTPNYGVTFSSNFFGLLPGQGAIFSNTLNTSNGGTVQILGVAVICPIACATGAQTTGIMNVIPGLSAINFYFSAGFTNGQTETVTFWSGANGTGSVLATISLANNNGSCSYCNWSDVGLKLTGTAYSVTFSGPADELGLADITLGSSSTAIPEPSSMWLLGTGIGALLLPRLRRFFSV